VRDVRDRKSFSAAGKAVDVTERRHHISRYAGSLWAIPLSRRKRQTKIGLPATGGRTLRGCHAAWREGLESTQSVVWNDHTGEPAARQRDIGFGKRLCGEYGG